MMTNRTITASASRAPSVSDGKGRSHLFKVALAAATALTPVWTLADQLPTGGTVVHGSAAINTPAPGAMTINQSSDRAVVNWDGFSIGQGNRVDIHQPSANSAILNRVTGDTTSQIHGQLNASGRVFVVNPNGIFIGKTGSVNTGGFVASTLGMRTDDFVTGKIVFEGNGKSANVENAGRIQVVEGGYAALIGGKVKNSGMIQAPLGFVGLASGERVTLDLAGDGFLQVALPTDSEDDGVEALIENSGTIQANGGTVQISAATARNAARHAINMSGVVEARTVSGRNGRISLGGGGGGKVTVSGKVRTKARRPAIQVTQSARPKMPPARGGDITITGREITLAGAEVDASGLNGGGNIRIGGELQGGPGLPTADTLTVDTSTMISADALLNGDGGRVIAWSDLSTDFHGVINIRGGDESGNGGFAEVSGRQDLNYRGFTNALAPNGEAGTLLLDPASIEIVSAAPVFNQIRDTDLEAALAGGNVVINTSPPLPDPTDYPDSVLGFGEQGGDLGDVTFVGTSSVTWNVATTLTINADNDIIVNGDVTPNIGTLDLNASNRVVINGPVSAPGGNVSASAGADFTIAGSGSLNTSSGTLTVNAGSIEIDGTVDISGGTNSLTAGTSLLIENANPFNAADATTSISTGTATIGRPLTITNGSLSLNAGSLIDITTAGSIVGANGTSIIDASTGSIVLDGPILTPGGSTTIGAYYMGGTITPGTGGEIDTGLFNLTSGAWQQNALGGAIADFSATNFVLNPSDASFLRVLDGDGAGAATAFEVSDIFGLQGVGSADAGNQWQLVNDIDASPTSGWSSLAAPVNGAVDGGFAPFDFSGTFEGNGNTISGMVVDRHSGTPGTSFGGLFGTNSGTIQNLFVLGADVDGPQVGIIAAQNNGTIDGVSVTGTVRANSTSGQSAFAGGITGINGLNGAITESISDVTVSDVVDPSAPGAGAEDLFIGGVAGSNVGTIERVRSGGSVSFDLPLVGRTGGIAGISSGAVTDVYSTATVAADTNNGTSGHAGNIVGQNSGTITNALANGPVSLVGGNISGGVGALVGTDVDISGTPNIFSSFYNTDVTGALPSGQNGEVDGGGIGPFDGARAKTQAELFDAQGFFDEADGAGWDFLTVWSLPLDGSDHARLYSVDLVASAFGETPDPSFEYAGGTSGYSVTGTYAGGPAVYRFRIGDSGNLSDLDTGVTFSGEDAGPITYTFPTSFTSVLGETYSVRSLQYNATITQRPITLSIARTDPANPAGPPIDDEAIKTYGDTLTPADVQFVRTVADAGIPEDINFPNAFFADPNSLISAGIDATATVAGSPYPLTINPLTFTGGVFDNYNITYVPATLFIDPASLTIDVNDRTKTVGEEVIFNGTEFTTVGLLNADTVDSLTITSAGAPATATVAGSPYSIDGINPVGTGITNYTVTINPGVLTVNDLPPPPDDMFLDIFLSDLTKTYGDTLVFTGTEFTSSGLQGGDTLVSLTITSAGAPADADVAGSPYAITGSNPVGTGLDDYIINIVPGRLTVVPAPLIVTANDQNKPIGTEFIFQGDEFTVSGLVNDDTITSATLSSAAAAEDAPFTGDEGVAIVITDPLGTGLENYQITLVAGVMIIAPNNLVITANDQTKTYGEEFTFDGTEFTVTGLAEGDSVDSVTLTSAGADGTAQVSAGPFTITASNAVGTGLENYTLTFADGTFTVVPAPLTVTANDQSKPQGQAFTFAGNEFTASGLLNGDTVDSAVLTSLGADAGASADDSPFAISVGALTGNGLDNYQITTVEGSFEVSNLVVPPVVNPTPAGSATISNPPDTITIAFPGNEGTGTAQAGGSSGSGPQQQTVGEAEATLSAVEGISGGLETAIQTCGNGDQDFSNYLTCLAESLDTYSNALDQIANDLPSGLETVSATIRTASQEVRAATARAQARLATATSAAERAAIRAQAIGEAQAAIDTAQTEIRKAISLIRADDPEVAAIQRQTGARIIQAFDTVDSELARAVEL